MIAAQDSQLRALSQTAFGTPLSWPAATDRAQMEATVRETLAACSPEVEALETDCSEPPCLVALGLGSLQYFAVMVATDPDRYRPRGAAAEAGENEQIRNRTRTEDLGGTFACR